MADRLPDLDLASARDLIRTQAGKERRDGFIYRFVRAAWLVLEALDAAEARMAHPSGVDLVVAIAADARAVYELYLEMPTVQLQQLQAAFTCDQAEATTPESVAFGAGRLALLAFVLKDRE